MRERTALAMALVSVLLLSGCVRSRAWHQSDGSYNAVQLHEDIALCRLESDKVWWNRRRAYNDCMMSRGYLHGSQVPNLARGTAPVLCLENVSTQAVVPRPRASPLYGDIEAACAERVAQGIADGLEVEALHRVLDGCLAEHGY
jgi:hypothetical protein